MGINKTDLPAGQTRMLSVGEVELELLEGGHGEPVLVLHGMSGLNEWQPYQAELARNFHVLSPSHPGFGHSSRPDWMDTIGDVAYFYQDVMEALDLNHVHLVGFQLGGWIAAEIAVRSCERLKSLTLVDAVGVKLRDPMTREIADTFSMSVQDRLKLVWHRPERANQKTPADSEMSDEVRAILLRNVETGALYTWKPFMHNPKLHHWLHRIAVPTHLVWGAHDGVVSTEYGKAYADCIPGARFSVVQDAGHLPQFEQPESTLAAISGIWSGR